MAAAFPDFGAEYGLMLGIFAAGCVPAVVVGRRVRGRATEQPVRRWFAVGFAAVMIPLQAWQLRPSTFRLGSSLPIQLCDLAWLAAVWALWTKGWRSCALLYFWGLTLSVQAIVTPSLPANFPDPLFFAYFWRHFLTVWAALFLTAGLGQGPRWRGFRFTTVCTAVWAVVVMVLNAVAGTNFGYLRHKPPSGSVLNLLGPWPVYVLVEAALVVGVWALITWPWERHDRRSRGTSPPPGGARLSRAVRRR